MWAFEAEPTNRAAEGLPSLRGPGEITHMALPFTAKPRATHHTAPSKASLELLQCVLH